MKQSIRLASSVGLIVALLSTPVLADMPEEDRQSSITQVGAEIGAYLGYRKNVARYAGVKLARGIDPVFAVELQKHAGFFKSALFDSLDGLANEIKKASVDQAQEKAAEHVVEDLMQRKLETIPGFEQAYAINNVRVAYSNEGGAAAIAEVTLIATGELIERTAGKKVATVTMPIARGALTYARKTFEDFGGTLYDSRILK